MSTNEQTPHRSTSCSAGPRRPASHSAASHSAEYLSEVIQIASLLNSDLLEEAVVLFEQVRAHEGRVFFLGVGGSAANCSHAVNDFRKLGGFEAYTPCDNVPELTARTNDDGWDSTYEEWIRGSRLRRHDLVVVLSVGGGDELKNISPNLVRALRHAQTAGAPILGIVSGNGGFTAEVATLSIAVPVVNPLRRTPHAEAFQSVLLHLLISHPKLALRQAKWESVQETASPRPSRVPR